MIQCINGDCLEVMKTLPDKSVDLFMCDLPYGCLKGGGGAYDRMVGVYILCEWDVKIDLVAFWEQVKRLCKSDKTPVLMFCNMKFAVELINSNPSWFRYDLVWNKKYGTGFLHANKRPMSSHEFICVFSKASSYYKRIDHLVEGKTGFSKERQEGKPIDGSRCFSVKKRSGIITDGTRCPLSVLDFCNAEKNKRHPTAKRVDLLKWLIERYSNEGDTVLDPTAGSFNSGRACVELGRNYIGIEKDEKFYNENKLE